MKRATKYFNKKRNTARIGINATSLSEVTHAVALLLTEIAGIVTYSPGWREALRE